MLNFYINWMIRFARDEKGQALAEYSLILAFIAMVCILALTAIGVAVSGTLGDVSGFLGGGGSP